MPQHINQLSDEELMARYQAGELSAFEAIYKRHAGRVLHYLQTKTSPETGAELLQEVFAKLHRSRSQYSPQYPFLPWIFAIARNTWVDHLRLNESRVARGAVEEIDLPAEEPDETPDLSLALETLPAPQRKAIELRYLSDWSFEQIATEMKTSPTNVRQVISRGIRKLRSWGGPHD